MTKPSQTIHPSLQRVLNISGQSMEEIALLLDISMTTLLRWSKHGVSQTAANKLGLLLGIDPLWILTGELTPLPKSKKSPKKPQKKSTSNVIREALLEFIETDNGTLILREVGSDEALVTINFADKVVEMVGEEHIQSVGQHMISAAIASVMERQLRQYHAHVYDEMPKRFS